MSGFRLIAADFVVSFAWVWSGSILRLLANRVLGSGIHPAALIVKAPIAVLYLYFFAWLRKATGGGSYNPLLVLCYAISGDFIEFLFTVFARIPAQVIGSIIGVRLINSTFPEAAHGPQLNVDIHRGAFTEGVLTFMIVIVSLGLKKIHPRSHAMKTWISSISKVTLHLLGSDITGGIMNPATAFGWAYAQGDHLTKEHLYVYWLAPMEGTLLGVWACSLFVKPKKHKGPRRPRLDLLEDRPTDDYEPVRTDFTDEQILFAAGDPLTNEAWTLYLAGQRRRRRQRENEARSEYEMGSL